MVLREALALLAPSLRAWYDCDEPATSSGMSGGVDRSGTFALFLSDEVLERPAVQFEVATALALNKPMVFLAPTAIATDPAQVAALLEKGRAFSANPVNQENGTVSLEPEDFDALEAAIAAGGGPIAQHRDRRRLLTETVPALLAALRGEKAPAPAPAPAPDAPYRMRRGAVSHGRGGSGGHGRDASDGSVDVLIVAAADEGCEQALFLHLALTRWCARRALHVGELLRDCDAAGARAAVAAAGCVVAVLTKGIWRCEAAKAALFATAELGTPAALLLEPDGRFGGCPFEEMLQDTPAPAKPLYGRVLVERFERRRAAREEMLRDLLSAIGATRTDALGGACPPPPLPAGYVEAPVARTLALLLAQLTGGGPARALVLSASGGGGKSTLASAVAHARGTQAAFDDVLWLGVGRASRGQLWRWSGSWRSRTRPLPPRPRRASALRARPTTPPPRPRKSCERHPPPWRRRRCACGGCWPGTAASSSSMMRGSQTTSSPSSLPRCRCRRLRRWSMAEAAAPALCQ